MLAADQFGCEIEQEFLIDAVSLLEAFCTKPMYSRVASMMLRT
jgi:hypothetical protein